MVDVRDQMMELLTENRANQYSKLTSFDDLTLCSTSKLVRKELPLSSERNLPKYLRLASVIFRHISQRIAKCKNPKLLQFYEYELNSLFRISLGPMAQLFGGIHSEELLEYLITAITAQGLSDRPSSVYLNLLPHLDQKHIQTLADKIALQITDSEGSYKAITSLRLLFQSSKNLFDYHRTVQILSTLISNLSGDNEDKIVNSIQFILAIITSGNLEAQDQHLYSNVATKLEERAAKIDPENIDHLNFSSLNSLLLLLRVVYSKSKASLSDCWNHHCTLLTALSKKFCSNQPDTPEGDILLSICSLSRLISVQISSIPAMRLENCILWTKGVLEMLLKQWEIRSKTQTDIALLYKPLNLQALVGLTNLSRDFEVEKMLNIFGQYVKVLALTNSEPFLTTFPRECDRIQIQCLGYVVKFFERQPPGEEFSLELLRVLSETLPHYGKLIHLHFTGESTNPQVILAILKFLRVSLSQPKSRTVFVDQGLLSFLISGEFNARLSDSATPEGQKCALLLMNCISNAAKDSSVRFKIKHLVGLSGQNEFFRFFQNIFTRSLSVISKGISGSQFADQILKYAAVFLNENFGHDQQVLAIFCEESSESKSFLLQIIDMLHKSKTQVLSLDLDDSAQCSIQPDTLLALCHLLDSFLRLEKAKTILIKSGNLKTLADLLQAEEGVATQPSSVLEKLISRILTDPSMVHLLAEMLGYSSIYETLNNPTVDKCFLEAIEKSVLFHRATVRPILKKLFIYQCETSLPDELTISKVKTALALGYICAEPMVVKTLSTFVPEHEDFPKFLCVQIWTILFRCTSLRPISSDQSGQEIVTLLQERTVALFRYMKLHITSQKSSLAHKLFFTNHTPAKSSCHLQSLLNGSIASPSFITPLQFIVKDNDGPSRTIPFDREALCRCSPVFNAMLKGSFKEGQLNQIHMDDFEYESYRILSDWVSFEGEQGDAAWDFDGLTTHEDCFTIFSLVQLSSKYILTDIFGACITWLRDILHSCATHDIHDIPFLIYEWLYQQDCIQSQELYGLLELSISCCVCTLPADKRDLA